MSDVGIYESKKHYATHKIFDEGDPVDKTKFSGIELKKAQVPKEMKTFLAEIYDGVISKDWKEVNAELQKARLEQVENQFDRGEITIDQYISKLTELRKNYKKLLFPRQSLL